MLRVSRLAMPELVYYYEEKEGAFLYNYKLQTPKTKSVFNLPAPASAPDFLAQELIVLLRKQLISAIPPRAPSRKIYASRSLQKTRRLQNEEQIWPLLEKRGFERVYFEEMSFQEQINVMLEAEIFMGVHGANMVNILFLQPGTKVVEMMNQDHHNEAYYLLASSLGLPYYSIPCITADLRLREAEDPVIRNDADLVVHGGLIESVLTGIFEV
jgi:capsular polysaccharide biosynthesis protein